MIAQIVVFRAKMMHKERKNFCFVPQKLRKSFANGNPRPLQIVIVTSSRGAGRREIMRFVGGRV